MAKALDFRKSKKPTLPISLDDELTVNIYTPDKALLEELLDSQEEINALKNGGDDRDKLDAMYNMCARILSNNREKREFSQEEVEDLLDTRDVIVLIRGYAAFVADLSKEKN